MEKIKIYGLGLISLLILAPFIIYQLLKDKMKQTTKNLFRAKKAVDYLNSKPNNRLLTAILMASIVTMVFFILVQLFAKYY